MGYQTEFYGQVEVAPSLNPEEIQFLRKFNHTRRMNRTKGPYFVDGSGSCGQGTDQDIISYNSPPPLQPSLWCQWLPTDDEKYIKWDGGEKFYDAALWMKYIIDHFIGSTPLAVNDLPFFVGHTCNGSIDAVGEDTSDVWQLIVENNVVSVARGKVTYGTPTLL